MCVCVVITLERERRVGVPMTVILSQFSCTWLAGPLVPCMVSNARSPLFCDMLVNELPSRFLTDRLARNISGSKNLDQDPIEALNEAFAASSEALIKRSGFSLFSVCVCVCVCVCILEQWVLCECRRWAGFDSVSSV